MKTLVVAATVLSLVAPVAFAGDLLTDAKLEQISAGLTPSGKDNNPIRTKPGAQNPNPIVAGHNCSPCLDGSYHGANVGGFQTNPAFVTNPVK